MKKIYLMVIFSLWVNVLTAQQARIVFYNVENLFDTENDPFTNDDEFLPDSSRHWNYERCWRKVVRIYQVLSAMDEWDMPAVVGLCEIENRHVLEKLVYDTPLEKYGFRIIHRESPDPRGIDVGFIYRKNIFMPDTSEWLEVSFGDGSRTREILKVSGRMWGDVPVHFYINHWPSRYGGSVSSGSRRLRAATVLAESVKRAIRREPGANIIIMGDFNDEPGDESLRFLETFVPSPDTACAGAVINLSQPGRFTNVSGTIKHQGSWLMFDQVLVSCALYRGIAGMVLHKSQTEIFAAPFLLEADASNAGSKPFRTYLGPFYHNGFSDHLPVSVVVEKGGNSR